MVMVAGAIAAIHARLQAQGLSREYRRRHVFYFLICCYFGVDFCLSCMEVLGSIWHKTPGIS